LAKNMVRLSIGIREDASTDTVISLLSSEDFVKENVPYVVGVENGLVRMRFRRALLFSFEDRYSVATGRDGSVARCSFNGSRSRFVAVFEPRERAIDVSISYEGPRRWVVVPCLARLGRELVMAAVEESRSRASTGAVGDYSERLALISWVSSLLMRSMLLKTEIVVVPRGGLAEVVEKLASEGLFAKYRVLYVSGSSDRGTFRLLFIDGKLAGVYATVGGKEVVGDERALNEFEGFTKIKVYGSNVPELPR